MVAGIKAAANYDPADGILLGIEGAEIVPPDAQTTIPVLTGDLFTSGHPELTCQKGVFQGYTVWLTRPTRHEHRPRNRNCRQQALPSGAFVFP